MERPTPDDLVHVSSSFVCDTDSRGHPTPGGRPPTEIVVDASEGFIPLWQAGTILRWRFRERSLARLSDPAATEAQVTALLAEALLAWGSAAPVRFRRDDDLWDFEIVVRNAPDCTASGCVLASAFFPDGGRHQLVIYPTMFEQQRKEQVETLVHELGHVFGLRHFFANLSETAWPSEIYGEHDKFTIMNYGANSVLTETDLADLRELYRMAWSGHLTDINGTPVKFVRPFSATQQLAPVAPMLV